MSVTNVQPTHRQCPRCRKIQPLHAAICDGCGRRFQMPAPEPMPAPVSGVYAGVSRETMNVNESSVAGRGVSAWWGPAVAALFATPLGWVLLPLALLVCVVTAALSVTVLPLILGVIASVRVWGSHLPLSYKAGFIALLLLAALGLNVFLWHMVHQLAFTANALR